MTLRQYLVCRECWNVAQHWTRRTGKHKRSANVMQGSLWRPPHLLYYNITFNMFIDFLVYNERQQTRKQMLPFVAFFKRHFRVLSAWTHASQRRRQHSPCQTITIIQSDINGKTSSVGNDCESEKKKGHLQFTLSAPNGLPNNVLKYSYKSSESPCIQFM
jgi:hypothetical protein